MLSRAAGPWPQGSAAQGHCTLVWLHGAEAAHSDPARSGLNTMQVETPKGMLHPTQKKQRAMTADKHSTSLLGNAG